MDTRDKILAAPHYWPAPRQTTIVTGYFDLLCAAQARELEAIRARTQMLVAVVLPLESELLSQHARAELAAALRVIDYVVIGGQVDFDKLVGSLHPLEVVRLEASDARRRDELVAHVQRRQIR